MPYRPFSKLLAVIFLLLCSLPIQAAIVVSGTRFIYKEDDQNISSRISNEGPSPVMVQIWTDDGDIKATPKNAISPFTVFNPVFRLDSRKSQLVRIAHTGDKAALPPNRESLFWLNIQEIPAMSKKDRDRNILQIALKTRLKLFYRPSSLESSVNEAPGQAYWTLENRQGNTRIRLHNPSPYHLSFSTISYLKKGEYQIIQNGGMLKPQSSSDFELGTGHDGLTPDTRIKIMIINDHGADTPYVAAHKKKFSPDK